VTSVPYDQFDRMRVLLLTYRYPNNGTTADRNTVYHLAKFLSDRGNSVHLVSFLHDKADLSDTSLVSPHCRTVETVFLPRWRSLVSCARGMFSQEPLQMWWYRSKIMHDRIRAAVRQYGIDVAYAYHLRMAQYLWHLEIPTIAALQPAQVLHFGRRAALINNPIHRWVYRLEHHRLVGFERRAAAQVDVALVISETDRKAIDPEGELSNLAFNPHGTDTSFFRPDLSYQRNPHAMVFTGMMGIDTNADAACLLARDILPLVRREIRNAEVWIVGRDPLPSVRRLGRIDGVTVTGYVDDVRPYLWQAGVAVNPMRIGAGLQNKILEAMAAGTPVACSEMANEGIGAPPNAAEIVSPNTAPIFAERVIALMRNLDRREELALNGRAFVEKNWSWEAHFGVLNELMQRLVKEREDSDE
jgi:sugar transferase (PEP-CTERM/EpsH1 system associated)